MAEGQVRDFLNFTKKFLNIKKTFFAYYRMFTKPFDDLLDVIQPHITKVYRYHTF